MPVLAGIQHVLPAPKLDASSSWHWHAGNQARTGLGPEECCKLAANSRAHKS